MVMAHLTLVTFTFDTVIAKSIWFICYPGWMCVPSLKKVDPDVPEFGNEMVTDYQQTDMYKVICTLFFERGHNKR